MAENGLYKYYVGLPPLARGIILVGILLLIIILIFWIYQTWKHSRDKAERDQEFIEDYKNYCKSSAGSQSYPATSYLQMADKIYEAGCSGAFCYGTDEEAIVGVFRELKTTCDAILLVQAFGKRFPRGQVCVTPWTGCEEDKLELSGWLKSELGEDWFKEINGVLREKGINFSI